MSPAARTGRTSLARRAETPAPRRAPCWTRSGLRGGLALIGAFGLGATAGVAWARETARAPAPPAPGVERLLPQGGSDPGVDAPEPPRAPIRMVAA